MSSYITVKESSEYEFEDRKSVFLGFAAPASKEEDAIAFINKIKKKYPDARHWVYAYVLRENSTTRYSDDREPQGTAGMPVLDIIRKNGCTDTVIVVVRYFGGILLGTGGLVHAYSEAALGALKAAKIIEYNIYSEITLTLNYSDYQKALPITVKYEFLPIDTDFQADVKIIGSVLKDKCDEFIAKVTEITGGRCAFEKINEFFGYRE